jgi:hypothetical protein
MISLTIITSVLLQNALARHGSAFNEPTTSRQTALDYGQGSIRGRCHVGESSVKVGVHRLKDYKIVREKFLPPVKR